MPKQLTMLISTALGAAAALGSAAYGAIKSSLANKKAKARIQDERDKNKRWYEYRMAEDVTGRSDAQSIITKQRELLGEQYKNIRATNAVAGGSEESVAAQKQAANNAVADTMSNIAADASNRKDAIEQQYRSYDSQLNNQQAILEQQQAQNIANAAGQAVNAGLGLIGAGINSIPATQPSIPAAQPSIQDQLPTNPVIGRDETAYQQQRLDNTIAAQVKQGLVPKELNLNKKRN